MTLLELEGVSKSYRRGSREQVALCDVSLSVSAGELLVIWGRRRSGRSTLLRVAAGAERPDAGVVCLEGRDLAEHSIARLGETIGYVQKTLGSPEGETVLEQVAMALLVRGVSPSRSRARTRAVLERVECADLVNARPGDLDSAERIRVAIARALASEPRLLVADEPTVGLDLCDRDPLLRLLRSLADDGIAVLMSAGESTAFLDADRALAISNGRLHGELQPESAQIFPLRAATSG
ncbi:MAG TPA: ATP-binding cassette domain-containing protein [Solirubrobacteraceae bacterium]|nr:ATP-binding cassette domain-containing protein [Solirubrobacteraceae bacterium]